MFVVTREINDPAVSTATCLGVLSSFGTGSGQNTLYPFTNGDVHDTFGSNVRQATGNPTQNLTAWHLYEVLTKSGEWTSWINGTQHFTTASNTVDWPTTLSIGVDPSTNHFLGELEEIALYSRDLTGSEITALKDYFADKYALTIA